ncbi:MAG: transporter [Deltaproteobacteria bacterium RBG_13_47_9]|nr:MAG: transporter [Deltaproteobacteria bacterium RBG_13_47_9]
MEALQNILYGFSVALTPVNLFYCLLGCIIGTLVGVLPGLGPAAAISLLLPATFRLDITGAIIMLAGIYYGAMYGGSTTSILVNIPGETSSVMTCIDGYQMAKQGRAGPALGIAAFGSLIAGTISVIGLMLLAPILAEGALRFGPPEYFTLMIMSLSLTTYLARGSMVKALMMACLGLILGVIGSDPVTGKLRFVYNITVLRGGLGMVPVLMGLFGVAEVLSNIGSSENRAVVKTKIRGILPTVKDWKDSLPPIIRGSFLGFILAILPGVGLSIPTFLSYGMEKKLSKTPERFGTGAIEGVAGPEAANNGAAGGTFVPMISLGIPPNATMALLLGALMLHGVQPGPLLIQNRPEIFWGLISSMYIGNIILLILNLPLIAIWVQVLRVPYNYLFSMIFLLCLIGSYSLNNLVGDVAIMVIFGGIGYLLKYFRYEAPPLILALILGPIIEDSFRQSLTISEGSFSIFFTRPIAGVFLLATLLSIGLGLFRRRLS